MKKSEDSVTNNDDNLFNEQNKFDGFICSSHSVCDIFENDKDIINEILLFGSAQTNKSGMVSSLKLLSVILHRIPII